ncbi:MAG: PKD domain-containing protein [Candidatus Bathyarchaeota archaeon]|nr:PKD domain-containing protein [Candidatus Bathyarchaeota archaeon]
MKTLNIIYLCRIGFGLLAAVIAALVVDLKVGNPLMNGITIGLAVYLVTYYLIKYLFTTKVDKPSKLLTMGIGIYFMSFVLLWGLLTTLMLAAPIAQFTVTPTPSPVGEPITFDARLSTDSDGEIVRYVWNFGDETTDDVDVPEVTHTYTDIGEFIITLIVVDDHGLSHTTTSNVTIVDVIVPT